MRVDRAEFEHAFHAVGESAKDGEQIGNDHLIILAKRLENFSPGIDAGDLAKPMLQDLHVNPEGEVVQSARFDPLPPVGGRVRVKERAVQTNESQVMRPAENFVREQLLHEQIPLHPVRRRAEHRDQLRVTTGSRQHFLRFSQVHRHPGLTENVFARFERGDRDCGMHGGRGADPDHIELGHA